MELVFVFFRIELNRASASLGLGFLRELLLLLLLPFLGLPDQLPRLLHRLGIQLDFICGISPLVEAPLFFGRRLLFFRCRLFVFDTLVAGR